MVNNDFYLNNACNLNNTCSYINTRLGWLDLMRIVACFLVVLSHATDLFFDDFKIIAIFKTFVSPCVPLFVMVSAVGLLPLKPQYLNTAFFYRNRLVRILVPLVIWSIILPLISYLVRVGVCSEEPAEVVFSQEMFNNHGLPRNLWTWIFSFNHLTYAYWFLYMIVGLYLIMPILNTWLNNSSQQGIKSVLFVWVLTLFLPYYKLIARWNGFDSVFGLSEWNANDTFYYVSGYAGYVILAYYLVKFPVKLTKRNKNLLVSSYFFGLLFTINFLIWTHFYKEDPWQYVLVLFNYCSFNIAMMVIPVFIYIQNSSYRSSKFLKLVASLTFGIYLLHVPLEWLFGYFIQLLELPMVPSILIVATLVFLSAGVITWILRQGKLTRKLVV